MRYRWTRFALLFSLLVEFTDIVMMRKCLLGIKRRAEQLTTEGSRAALVEHGSAPEALGTT